MLKALPKALRGCNKDLPVCPKAPLGCLRVCLLECLLECLRLPVVVFRVLRVALPHLFRVCVMVALSGVGGSRLAVP